MSNEPLTAFTLGKIIWEARLREAWGKHAENLIRQQPWPKHIASHDIAAEHQLCIVQAEAAIKALKSKENLS